jgi:hypothetical protein
VLFLFSRFTLTVLPFEGFLAVFFDMKRRMVYFPQLRTLWPSLPHAPHLRLFAVFFFFFICFTLSIIIVVWIEVRILLAPPFRAATEALLELFEHRIGVLGGSFDHVVDELVGILDIVGGRVPDERVVRPAYPKLFLVFVFRGHETS